MKPCYETLKERFYKIKETLSPEVRQLIVVLLGTVFYYEELIQILENSTTTGYSEKMKQAKKLLRETKRSPK